MKILRSCLQKVDGSIVVLNTKAQTPNNSSEKYGVVPINWKVRNGMGHFWVDIYIFTVLSNVCTSILKAMFSFVNCFSL